MGQFARDSGPIALDWRREMVVGEAFQNHDIVAVRKNSAFEICRFIDSSLNRLEGPYAALTLRPAPKHSLTNIKRTRGSRNFHRPSFSSKISRPSRAPWNARSGEPVAVNLVRFRWFVVRQNQGIGRLE
jgi:hypothetical protein